MLRGLKNYLVLPASIGKISKIMRMEIFEAQNPWRFGRLPDQPRIDRSLLGTLLGTLDRGKVDLVLGARSTGKSTLVRHLIREAILSGRYQARDVYYLDLDTMGCEDVLASNATLLQFLGESAEPRLIVIDEAQRLENPGLLLKSIHDLDLPLKLVATGSSSLEIRSKIKESLAGRRFTHFLWPLSPQEWESHFGLSSSASGSSYMRFGGYPEVALAEDPTQSALLLAELLRAYLDRDVVDFLRVGRLDIYHHLLRLLAAQTCGLVNLNELASTLGVSQDTISRYLLMLEETFILRRVSPFFRNVRSELTKMPKVYFMDLGLRNLLLQRLHAPDAPASHEGAELESFVFLLLHSLVPVEALHFWRTHGKAEVDFVVELEGRLLPIEVKARAMHRPEVPGGLRSFLKAYQPERALVLNETMESEISVGDSIVEHVSRERWLPRLVEILGR